MSVIGSNILAGASGAGGGYQISRSVRLRASASAYLQRTNATTGTDPLKLTVSGWMKRGASTTYFPLLGSATGSAAFDFIGFSGDNIGFRIRNTSSVDLVQVISTAVYRDFSAWYHIVAVYDSANATSTERVKLYVNGVQITALSIATYPSLNQGFTGDFLTDMQIGRTNTNSSNQNYGDGYITEVNFIDGQALTPSSFGETDAVTGVWKPKKYTGTYGTNGFYLNFSDNSAATAAAIGKDYSGNGNNWTPNNISVTAGVTYDSMLDVPTQWADGGNGRGNYATLNPLQKVSGYAPDNGNLRSVMNATGNIFATIGVTTGKWYWENIYEVAPNGEMQYGVALASVSTSSQPGNVSGSWSYSPFTGAVYSQSNTPIANVATAALNDVIGLALDVDAGTLAIYKNNSLLYTITSISGGTLFPVIGGSASINARTSVTFGQRPFTYTPPTGFKALNTLNLPTPTILKGNQYFDATLWNGQNTTLSVTNSGAMQPDFVWIKKRNGATDHNLTDAVRGTNRNLISNSTAAEDTVARLTSFDTGGFTLAGAFDNTNISGSTYVGWQWKEGATQGFDIVTYTGDGTSARAISHSLGVAPKMIIIKQRNAGTYGWVTYHASVGAGSYLTLNGTGAAAADTAMFNNTAPTSSVFTLSSGGNIVVTNPNTGTMVAYLFAEVAGFSKFGSYTGNGSADGPFVFCGFRPRFIMIKSVSTVNSWHMTDTSRSTYNQAVETVWANESSVESTSSTQAIDILSNGFKIRNSTSEMNNSGTSMIYMAFAENPFRNSLAR